MVQTILKGMTRLKLLCTFLLGLVLSTTFLSAQEFPFFNLAEGLVFMKNNPNFIIQKDAFERSSDFGGYVQATDSRVYINFMTYENHSFDEPAYGVSIRWVDENGVPYEDLWGTDNTWTKEAFRWLFSEDTAELLWEDFSSAELYFQGVEYGVAERGIPGHRNKSWMDLKPGEEMVPWADVQLFKGRIRGYEIQNGLAGQGSTLIIKGFNTLSLDWVYIEESEKTLAYVIDSEEVARRRDQDELFGRAYKRYVNEDPRWSYYLYVPENYSSEKDYSLVMAYHGDGGSGRYWAEKLSPLGRDDFIIVAPNFSFSSERPSGISGGAANDEAARVEEDVRSLYPNIQSKLYLVGFSAGIGYVHGFAQSDRDRTAAIAMHAGRYLNSVGYARDLDTKLPVLVTCGTDDFRYQNMQAFYKDTLDLNFLWTEAVWIPGIGHQMSGHAVEATINFMQRVKDSQNN